MFATFSPGSTSGWKRDWRFPIKPVWPGELLSAVFYALVWRGWFCVSWWSRQRLYKARGVCPTCRYKVGELSVCPECGREKREESSG